MKTQFLSFGGGLLTGLCLFLLLSASSERNEVAYAPNALSDAGKKALAVNEYVEVPLKEFFNDVARYNRQHATVISTKMRKEGAGNKDASRMFLYSVSALEKFFDVVKAYGEMGQIEPEKLAIRFYYGVYPKGTKIRGDDYSSLHTLFMSPNYWSETDKRFRDFDIKKLAVRILKDGGYGNFVNKKDEIIKEYYLEHLYEANESGSRAFLLDATAFTYSGSAKPQKASFLPSFLPEDELVVINQGQLCPPNCPDRSLLTYIDDRSLKFNGEW